MKTLYKLCSLLNLGEPVIEPEKVAGGLLHKMWHIRTHQAAYAIKQLNSHIVTSSTQIKELETSENIARTFAKHNVPVAAALLFDNKSVIELDDEYFIVYPWVDAKTLGPDEVSVTHAQKMGTTVAGLHKLNIQLKEHVNTQYDLHPADIFKNLIDTTVAGAFPYSPTLEQHATQVLEWNQDFQNAIPKLSKQLIICHGDLDQKNVLWTKDHNPVLIDWESARLLNPMQEMMTVALDWSGISTGVVYQDIFTSFLKAYIEAGGVINESQILPAFGGVRGNWLNWLYYNLERSLGKHVDQHDDQILGIKQAGVALSILITIDKNLDAWTDIVRGL